MDEKQYQAAPRRRFSRRIITLLAILFALIIVGLAVGLGVGLTRRNNNNNGAGSSSSSTPTASMTPIPSFTPSQTGLWQPAVNASWQIVLLKPLALDLTSNSVTPNVDVWDIDMFTNSKETIDHLHNLGKKVICYFSAGSYESYRPDSTQFLASDQGSELDGWPGEKWLVLNSTNVRNIMAERIKLAAYKGCDAIDPDNVDGYSNKNGLGLTEQDSIDFVTFLSDEAAKYNMSTGLKNAAAIIPSVIQKTAFNVNEQCAQYTECAKFDSYIQNNKPVFHIEYPKGDTTNNDNTVTGSAATDVCSGTGKSQGADNFSTVIKNMNLDGWIQLCNGQTALTPLGTAIAKGGDAGTKAVEDLIGGVKLGVNSEDDVKDSADDSDSTDDSNDSEE